MLSVLYVDDERDLLELGKLFLERTPEFHVETATSAKDVLASTAFASYDAIISDYQMPEMDGIAFLKAVRKKYGNVPFILFTGRGREEIVIEAINNGVDFYLQKGGDIKSQFAELSHKIRQAVARQKAEHSLVESEKRLTDIINFLPDATFAIDREGVIIAWNRAIEEMTGLPAETMLGKGNHEYALPFYGERRPILVDLIFEPSEVIEQKYAHIVRQKDILIADTTLPHLKGREVTLYGKAIPLYDSQGEIVGAIEAIRDITEQKNAEDELRAAYEQITASEEELREQLDVLEESEQRVKESASRLEFMLGFYERAYGDELNLLNYAVDGAGVITGSPLGYLAFLNKDESELTMYAWSKNAMEECSLREKPIVYKTEKTGLWGEAVRQRRAVITNDYAAPNPAKKGYPTGHPVIVRHMNIPVIDEGHIVMVAGVANKPQDYSDEDVKQLSLLMQGLWQVIKQRQTKQELSRSEEKYHDLFENSVIGIFRTTPEGKFSAINTTFARIAGYASSAEMLDVVGDIRTQLYVREEDRDRFLAAMSTEGFVKDFEAQFYHRDGHPIWINLNANTIRDTAGVIRFFEGTIEDIDEKKNIGQALRTEKTFSDTVVDSVPGLLYLYDSEGLLVRWNKNHETITGYTADELRGMNVLDWFKGDDEAVRVISEAVGRALQEGQSTAEANLLTKSGGKIPFFFTAKRLEIDGKTFFTGVGIDITERQRAQDEIRAANEQLMASQEELQGQLDELAVSEQRIRQSEEKYRNVIDFSPFGMHFYTLHDDGSLVFTESNSAADRILGVDNRLFIGRTIEEAFPGLAGTEIPDQYRRVARHGDTWHTEQVIYNQGMISGAFSVSAFRIRPGVMAAAFFDITERKRAEEELRAANEQLTASDEELRSQFDELAAAQEKLQMSQQQLEEISGTVPGVVYQFYARPDGSMGMYYVSSRAAEIFGFDNATQEFFSWFTGHVDPHDHDRFLESVTNAVKAGQPWDFEGRFVKPSGEMIWFQGISRPIARPAELVYSGVLLDITDRKHAEEALHENEEKYRTLVETTGTGFVIIDDQGRVLDANPEYIHLSGHSNLQEIAGRSVTEWTAAYEQDRNAAAISQCMRDGHNHNFEIDYVDASGKITPIEINATVLQYGDSVRILTLCRDISERRRTRDTLRESEAKYRTVIEQSQDGIFIAQDGLLVFYNPSFATLTGYSSAELAGRSIADMIAPEDREMVLTRHRERLSGKHLPEAYEFSVLHRDGTSRILVKMSITSATIGGRPATIGTLHNVMEERKREEALRVSEERFRKLIAGSFDAVVIHQAGRIVLTNEAAARIIGAGSTDELVGRPILDLVHPEFRATVAERVRQMLQSPGGTAPPIEEKFVRHDGTAVDVEVMAIATQHEGQPAVMVVFRNITERKMAEAQLQSRQTLLDSILQSTEDGILVITDQGEVLTTNRRFHELWQIPENLIASGRDEDLLAHVLDQLEDPEGFLTEVKRLYETDEESWSTLRFKDGRIFERYSRMIRLDGRNDRLWSFRDVTERKLAEETLRQSESRLRLITGNMVDQITQFDTNRIIWYVSPSVERQMGFKPDELIGKLVTDYLHPDDVERVIRETRDAITAHLASIRLEYRYRHKNGDYRWFESEVRILYDKDGVYSGQIFTSRDITQRKSIEVELSEKIEEINLYFNTGLDLFCIADTDGYFRRLNPEWENTLGYTVAELEGKRFLDLVHPDDLQATLAAVADLSSQREVLNFTNRYRHKDGTYRWIEWRSRPHGKQIFAAARDITTRKAAEKALREAEKNYRTLVENSQSIIYTIRPDGIMTFVSPRWQILLGHEPSEVVDHDFRSFVNKDDIPSCDAFLQKTVETRTTQPGVEYRVFHKDGSTRWHRSNITPVFDDQNSLVSFVGNAVDITEQRSMEYAIREANHKLNLLNNITRHDVANQLTILLGYAQIAAVKKGDPVIADYLTRIIAAADTISRQIEFTRTYQELGVKAPVWNSLEEVIAHGESRVPVRFSGTCRGMRIFSDPMLERVFFNLVDNAVRHGGRVTEITVRCEREPDGILVIVEDNGMGIPVADKEKIFERGVGKNTGLGLFLVREILSITGITIRETGIYGKGAQFEIRVPEGTYRIDKP